MKQKIEANSKAGGHFLESMRSLATNIEFSGIDKPVKSITVTSTLPYEGKSTISMYLAHAFADMGRNTALVESDMRHPILHKRLEVKRKNGFINYLTGQCGFDEIIDAVTTNLSFINCGAIPPDAVEVLGSERFANFVREIYGRFDVLIFDAPPVGVFIDAAIVSSLCDGVVYVVDSGKVDYKKAQTAIEQLRKANARILGVALNNTDPEISNYYYYYDYNNRKQKRKRYSITSTRSLDDQFKVK